MRLQQGSHLFGLGGIDPIAPAPAWPEGRGIWYARPVLALPREALREVLRARGERWIDDPSNDNTDHERVRARRRLAATPGLRGRAGRLAWRLALVRRAAQRALAGALDARVRCHPDGSAEVDLSGLSPGRRMRLLSPLVQAIAGVARPPRGEQLGGLVSPRNRSGATASGVWALPRGEARWYIARDPGPAVCAWCGGVWDGRFVPDPGGEAPMSTHAMAARTLPPQETPSRALAPDRLAQLCRIWRQV